MMRIGSGELRGRKLHVPRGLETRPTGGRLKKSLFDTVASVVERARVLDLFAGAGALGLEALSRGAASAVFVERSRRAAEAIVKNIDDLGLTGRAELRVAKVQPALARLAEEEYRFDLVFADPPYGAEELVRLLRSLGEGSLVEADGLVIVEHHHKQEIEECYGDLERTRVLRAGESCFTVYMRVC